MRLKTEAADPSRFMGDVTRSVALLKLDSREKTSVSLKLRKRRACRAVSVFAASAGPIDLFEESHPRPVSHGSRLKSIRRLCWMVAHLLVK